MFQAAYGRSPNYEDIARAIAAFERTLVFLDAPFDDFVAGKPNAISPAAQQGWALFNGKARCVTCHSLNPDNPIGSDNRFHNIGVAARHQDFEKLASAALTTLASNGGPDAVDKLALSTDLTELGRFLVSKQRSDIALTAPYMHDGSMQTLWDVMDHYNKGGEANTYLDGGIEPLALSEAEIDQLVAFMFTLTDHRFEAQGQAAFAAQQKRARTHRPFRDNALAMRKVLPFERRVEGDGGKGKKEN
jgi:cytochrome c peroxidase